MVFYGLSQLSVSHEDSRFLKAKEILGISLDGIFEVYQDDYYFFEPQLIYKPEDHSLSIKVGMLDKETWDNREMCENSASQV